MPGNQQIFQQAMNQGHSAAWDMNWEEAVTHYSRALQEMPENPQALTSLGLALFEMGNFKPALDLYLKAAALSKDDPMPYEKIGRIHERMGNLTEAVQATMQAAELHLKTRHAEKAIDDWLRVTALRPDHLMAHTRLGMVYERMNRKEDAIAEYLTLASLAQRNGEMQKASQLVEHSLELQPSNADAQQAQRALLGNQLLPRPMRPHGVTGALRMAEVRKLNQQGRSGTRGLDPVAEARQQALVALAELLFEEEDTPHTEKKSPPAYLPFLSQAIQHQTQGNDAQAASELEKAVSKGLKHPAVSFDLGLLVAMRDRKKALRFLQEAVAHPDFSLAAHFLMGRLYRENNEFTQAVSQLLQALCLADIEVAPAEQAEGLRQVYESVIETHSRRGDKEKLQTLCENITTQLNRPNWREHLSAARQQLPESSEDLPPLPLAELLFDSESSAVIDAMSRIRRLADDGRLASAIDEAFNALLHAPYYLPLHIQIGELLMKDGQIQAASEKMMLVARLYSLRGEIGSAVQALRRVTQNSPLDIEVRQQLIQLLTKQGRSRDAVLESIQLAGTYYQLAQVDLARDTYANALRMAQQAHLERSIAVKILYHIADIDQQRLDWRSAVRILEQIRSLEPNDSAARSRLVNLYFKLGQDDAAHKEIERYLASLESSNDANRSIDFLQQVVTDHPEKLDVRKRLADILVKGGLTAQAVEQMDAMAEEMISRGNRPGATDILRTIIQLNPNNVNDYEDLLNQIQREG